VIRLVREAQDVGAIPDGDARFYAIGVLGAVSSFSHALRQGRFDIGIDELAVAVGDWVTQALRVQIVREPAGTRPAGAVTRRSAAPSTDRVGP
jgi:hypothetical protein